MEERSNKVAIGKIHDRAIPQMILQDTDANIANQGLVNVKSFTSVSRLLEDLSKFAQWA